MKMNEVLMAEDVLRPYGITLYYKGCEYLRDAIILHWHQPDLIPGQLIQLVANQNGVNQLVQDAIRNQQSRQYDQCSGESPG